MQFATLTIYTQHSKMYFQMSEKKNVFYLVVKSQRAWICLNR